MSSLLGQRGVALIEASLSLWAIVSLFAFLAVLFGGHWARFHLDRQLYESLICVSEHRPQFCQEKARRRLRLLIPVGNLLSWNLRLVGPVASGSFLWELPGWLQLKGRMQMNLDEVRR